MERPVAFLKRHAAMLLLCGCILGAAALIARTTPAELYIQSGATKRISIPSCSENYQMTAYDRGAEIVASGITVTLPVYSDVTMGEVYTVINNSSGNAVITTAQDEFFVLASGTSSNSLTIPAGASRSFLRRKLDGNFVVAGLGAATAQSIWRVPLGTPDANRPGADGDVLMDQNYIYTFRSGVWSKSARVTLNP